MPAVHQICLTSGVKRRAEALAWWWQSDATAHVEVFAVSYLDDSPRKIIVFVDEVDLLIQALLGANAAELSSWQLLEHTGSMVVNPWPRSDEVVHVDRVAELAAVKIWKQKINMSSKKRAAAAPLF